MHAGTPRVGVGGDSCACTDAGCVGGTAKVRVWCAHWAAQNLYSRPTQMHAKRLKKMKMERVQTPIPEFGGGRQPHASEKNFQSATIKPGEGTSETRVSSFAVKGARRFRRPARGK